MWSVISQQIRYIVGILAIVVGLLGLFLPIIPGLVLIIAGLALLKIDYEQLRERMRNIYARLMPEKKTMKDLKINHEGHEEHEV